MHPESKILVTGAAGFIGGWVAESLYLNGFTGVRAAVRRPSGAVRLARFPLDIVSCDITDPAHVDQAMEGREIVIHCAYGSRTVNVDGTRNVLDAALRHGVKRVIHLSTVSVYGPVQGTVLEEAPRPHTGDDYGDSKLDAETVCEEYIARGLPVVILRPTVVYGPFSKQWIVKFAERMESGRWAQFGQAGEGRCNPVYVMDLVRAIILSIESSEAVGQAFNVNGPEVISWNEYFSTLNEALHLPPLKKLGHSHSRWRALMTEPPRWMARQLLRTSRPLLASLRQRWGVAKRAMDAGERMLKNTPSGPELAQFGQNAVYSCEKARRVLHYRPSVGFQEGMRRSVAWLMHERPPFPQQ